MIRRTNYIQPNQATVAGSSLQEVKSQDVFRGACHVSSQKPLKPMILVYVVRGREAVGRLLATKQGGRPHGDDNLLGNL